MIPLRNKRCILVLRWVYREFHLSRHQASHSSQWAEANKWGRRRAKRGWSCLTRSSLCGAWHALKWHPQINQDFYRLENKHQKMGLLEPCLFYTHSRCWKITEKSLIQHCDRNGQFCEFWKPKANGQTMLPDRWKNLTCDILANFQTLCSWG